MHDRRSAYSTPIDNNRKNPYLFRDTLKKLVTTNALEYKKLTAYRYSAPITPLAQRA